MLIDKILLGLTCICFLSGANAQTADMYLQNGFAKHREKDYKGAITEYDKAIKADKENKDAWFNRGICELALKDYKAAYADFTKTIELDGAAAKAYYSRASALISDQQYEQALPDLDKAIELDATLPNALTLRGQLRVQTGNTKGGCEDFAEAIKNGDKSAQRYKSEFCGNEQPTGESLVLNWPVSENWKIGSNRESEKVSVIELIHADETLDNWTELGSMTSIKGMKSISVDKAMKMMHEQAKQQSSKVNLTVVERNATAEFPWIIFTIESPRFSKGNTPESQLWYIVRGKMALYSNFIAVRKATMPADMKKKWTTFFKTGKVVYKK